MSERGPSDCEPDWVDFILKRRVWEIEREALEQQVRQLHQSGRIQEAAQRGLAFYERELLLFLLKQTAGSHEQAEEVYSAFQLHFWRSFATFRWDCSLRTWCYIVLRKARTHRRDKISKDHRQWRAFVETAQARLATYKLPLTTKLDRLAAEVLTGEDRDVLHLRTKYAMRWQEIAQIISKGKLTGDALARKRDRLKKRFERNTVKLRQAAAHRGWIRTDTT